MPKRGTEGVLGLCLLMLWSLACDDGEKAAPAAPAAAADSEPEIPEGPGAEEKLRALLDAEYPMHAAVTGIELRVLQKPDEASPVVGWLRTGGLVRLGRDATDGPGCKRYHHVYPRGYVCDDEGLALRDGAIPIQQPTDEGWKTGQVDEAEKQGALVLPPPPRDAVLPYDYYFVKETVVPEYHRLPSRNEQRAAMKKAEFYLKMVDKGDKRARDYLTGAKPELGPPGTAIVARYLDRGFFVASSGSELRAFRRFVRTTQGRYIKQARLETRSGHDFQGVTLDGKTKLPLAWTTRTARPMRGVEKEEGGWNFSDDEDVEAIERQTLLTGWQGRKNLGGRVMHILETPEGPRYLKAWFASVAEPIARPKEVPGDSPWVHVDLSEQTLVLYRGDAPVYATLVSTGVEDNETPVGVFQIEKKRITDTMANIGPEAGDDRYRIEDVPYVQYFEGSFALHAAFWHTRFGLPRSHGCVNLAPKDAHVVFGHTLPRIPDGFHGLSTEGTRLPASHVVVTE